MVRKCGIVIASDKGSKGQRIDQSGALIAEIMVGAGYQVTDILMVPDEHVEIVNALTVLADQKHCHVVLTTGGTGFSKRDVTPEATRAVIQREAPGIAEAMRFVSYQVTKKAILSRAIAGIRNETIIINLPGSPKAVNECMDVILDTLSHGIDILCGDQTECGTLGDKA